MNMTEKNDGVAREILIRTQDGCQYKKFEFPIYVVSADEWNKNEEENRHGYVLAMFFTCIGEYEEKKHAIHVMNFLLAKRNHYMFDDVGSVKSIILNVPTDEAVKLTPEESLIDGIPVKENNEVTKNESISE